MRKAFDKIAAGFEDAIAFAQGDGSRGCIARPGGLSSGLRKEPSQEDLAVGKWTETKRPPA